MSLNEIFLARSPSMLSSHLDRVVLPLALLAVCTVTYYLARTVGKHFSPIWKAYVFLAIGIIPFIELMKITFGKGGSSLLLFTLFWGVFFVYCLTMFFVHRERASGDREG